MKLTLIAAFMLALIGTAFAAGGHHRADKLRLADASSAACVSNCSTQAAFLQAHMPCNVQYFHA